MNDGYTIKQIKKHISGAEKTIMLRINTSFLFTREFIDFDGKLNYAKVNLIVDYTARTFQILPVNGDKFNFNYCYWENIKLQKVVLTIMQEAYDFGVKEISNV